MGNGNLEQGMTVYDKSDYHLETTQGYGLDDSHASHHTLFFFRWVVDTGLMSEEFISEAEPLEEYKTGKRSILSLYEWWDCCLVDDMLSDEGNSFAQHYFDFDKGQYLKDYMGALQGSLPSEFHIEFTEENYSTMRAIIDRRYQEWKHPKISWWPFGKK
jgi:hypothetical protein